MPAEAVDEGDVACGPHGVVLSFARRRALDHPNGTTKVVDDAGMDKPRSGRRARERIASANRVEKVVE
jgi:hypothetical protein